MKFSNLRKSEQELIDVFCKFILMTVTSLSPIHSFWFLALIRFSCFWSFYFLICNCTFLKHVRTLLTLSISLFSQLFAHHKLCWKFYFSCRDKHFLLKIIQLISTFSSKSGISWLAHTDDRCSTKFTSCATEQEHCEYKTSRQTTTSVLEFFTVPNKNLTIKMQSFLIFK